MQDTIQFDEGALDAALADLSALCTERVFSSGGSGRILLDSIGDTAREINKAYASMRRIEAELQGLFLVTKSALENAGVAFPKADAAAAADFSSISAQTTGG